MKRILTGLALALTITLAPVAAQGSTTCTDKVLVTTYERKPNPDYPNRFVLYRKVVVTERTCPRTVTVIVTRSAWRPPLR